MTHRRDDFCNHEYTCDTCGDVLQAFINEEYSRDYLAYEKWRVDGEKHYCANCKLKSFSENP